MVEGGEGAEKEEEEEGDTTTIYNNVDKDADEEEDDDEDKDTAQIKVSFFKWNVHLVLLYGSETWEKIKNANVLMLS